MESKLTYLEAFNSMRCFLEKYYQLTDSDDVGSLLGIMQFLEDGSTADPAVWLDWIECVNKISKQR
ncbi:MAG: hypothetical protein KDK56_08050 [Simkania sp.]|nr:hypothetical protein [Simkania sp.]